MDGNLTESSWTSGAWTPLPKVVNAVGAPVTITARFKTRWDATYLYFGVDVNDTTPNVDSGATPWDDDAVELFLDMNDNKSGPYQADDEQYVMNYNLSQFWVGHGHGAGVLRAVALKAANKGYTMEIAVPWANWGITPAGGQVYGADVAVDSDYNGGTRDGTLVWSGDGNDSSSTTNFGDITLASCAATPTPTQTALACTTPGCINSWTIVGTGSTMAGGVHLTDDTMWQATAMWANSKLDLTQNFDAQYDLYFGTKDATGADGIVFVLQNDLRGLAAIGDNGQGLSYGGVLGPQEAIQPSVDVEFDTWQNNGGGDPLNFHDPANDHTSIHLNGNADETSGAVAPAVDASSTSGNIEDGLWHRARITWDASTHIMNVYFDGVLRQTWTSDIVNTVFGGQTCVYWGFTSGTGGSSNVQEAKEVSCYSPTSTSTPTPTITKTGTATPTLTVTPVVTATFTSTITRTQTVSPSWTASPIVTATSTPTTGACSPASAPAKVQSGIIFSTNPGAGPGASYTVPAGTSEMLFIRLETNSATVPSGVVYSGLSMTLADSQTLAVGGLMQTWYLLSPPTGVARALSVTTTDTFSGNTYNISATVYSGVNQTTPIGNKSFVQNASAITWTNGLTTGTVNSLIDQFDEVDGAYGSFTVGAAETNFSLVSGCCNPVAGAYQSAPTAVLYNFTSTFDSAKSGASEMMEIKGSCPVPTATPTPRFPLTKTSSLATVNLGDTLTFCVNWTNDASSTQTIVAWDTVSSYITYQSCNGSCSKSGNVVSWSNSVAAGGSGSGCFWGVVSSYPP